MSLAVCRIAKLKQSNLAGSEMHVSRRRSTPNADRDRSPQNRSLIIGNDQSRSLTDLVATKIALTHQGAVRSNAVHAVEFLLSASPEYFRPNNPTDYGVYDPARLDAWAKANVEWLQREYGDRIVKAELHLDEATPHIHAYLVPIDERGQLNCRGIFGERKNMFALQDSYAAAMEPLGIERGIRGSKARHTDVDKYYTAVNEFCDGGGTSMVVGLQAENAKLEQRLSDVTDERDKLREKIESLSVEIVGITPVINKTKASSTNSNRPPNRSPISDGDPRNYIRDLQTRVALNKPTAPPTKIVTPLSTVAPPKIEKIEVATLTLAINSPEIEISGKVTESEREETPRILSPSRTKPKDRGGR